ncbi:MAG: 6-phosphogluconolactonase [Cucumibacter sp.]
MTTVRASEKAARRDFASPDELAASLADQVAAALRGGIAARGQASLLVSGGSTPKRFFRALAAKKLDWSKVAVSLVDERWVPPDSERSNARLVVEHLLVGSAGAARFLRLYVQGKSVRQGAAELSALAARTLARPFDAVILGMGNDGHTASFFPNADNLATALAPDAPPLVAIEVPGAGEPRITFALSELLNAGLLALHIEGAAKAATLARALAPGPVEDMPVRAVLRQRITPLTIYWCP